MFKLDMNVIRQNARDPRLMANPANHSPEFAVPHPETSQLAGLAISHPLRESANDAPAPDPLTSVRQAAKDAVNDLEPPVNPKDWHELAVAYSSHHFACPSCQAAGRGTRYGLRCGAGMALWGVYQGATP